MALTDPTTTLAYHQSRVFTSHRDMRNVPCENVSKMIKAYFAAGKTNNVTPEGEALWFYGMNHAVSLISAKRAPLEPLDAWELTVLNAYHAELSSRAVRAFYYLLLICTRESRHNKNLHSHVGAMAKEFGANVVSWCQAHKSSEHGIQQAFINSPPDATLGEFVDCLRYQYYKCNWSTNYGGPAWGKVTDCLKRFVDGEFSAEMMMDTIWTLAHNTGPIFNKGMLYVCQNNGHLLRILDIQRSGQVPEGVLTDKVLQKYVDPQLLIFMKELSERFPDAIGPHVSWIKVQSLGAVGNWASEVAAQKKALSMTPEEKALLKKQEEEAKAATAAAAKEKAEHHLHWLEIMPGIEVAKIKMERAA